MGTPYQQLIVFLCFSFLFFFFPFILFYFVFFFLFFSFPFFTFLFFSFLYLAVACPPLYSGNPCRETVRAIRDRRGPSQEDSNPHSLAICVKQKAPGRHSAICISRGPCSSGLGTPGHSPRGPRMFLQNPPRHVRGDPCRPICICPSLNLLRR